MSMLRVVAVDDEQLALDRVRTLIEQTPGVELVGTARTAEEAVAKIQRLRPDVVLLDIKLTGSDGFEVVQTLTAPDAPALVFVSAYGEYALQAFDVSATDFVTKPVELARLRQAFDKVRALRRASAAADEAPAPEASAFWVERRGQYRRLRHTEIDWIEAAGDYVALHAGDAQFLVRGPLHKVEARLTPDTFVRVRRSALIRRDAITGIQRRKGGRLSICVGPAAEVDVGRTYESEIRTLLAEMRAGCEGRP